MSGVMTFVRPSNLGALSICAGKAQMESRAVIAMPVLERLESPQAAMGTLGHLVIAQTLALMYHGDDAQTRDQDECLAKMSGAMARLSEWDRDVVRRCVGYAVALIEKYRPNRDGILIEQKMCGKLIGIARGGTADLVLVCGDIVIVLDHKCGFLDQGHAAEHVQTAAYAVMAYDKFKCREVHVHLAQGRLAPGNRFSSAAYDVHAIAAARSFTLGIVTKASMVTAQLSPSIKACRYCKALTVCREARGYFMRANDSMSMFGAPETPEDRLAIADAAAIAKRFSDEVKLLQKQWAKEIQADQGQATP